MLSHRVGRDDEGDDLECIYSTESKSCQAETPSQAHHENLAVPTSKDIKLYSAKWLLKTSETRSLTRTASVGIVEDVSSLIEVILNGLKSDIKGVLASNQVDNSVILKTEELFKSSACIPYEGLCTFYQQMQYYKENFNLIVS